MDENIIIQARKRSSDPLQEHLRQQKALWNGSASDLIAKIISFKRGLNGHGDPRAGLPSSNIKDPVPPQIGQTLHDLSVDFNALIDAADDIIKEQDHYSQTRQKSKQLSKNSSWFGSRWWAGYFGPSGKDRAAIRTMLRAASSFRHKLLDVENHLSSSDPNSIAKALYVTSSFGIGPYKNILQAFDSLQENHGRELVDPAPPPKPLELPKAIETSNTNNSGIVPAQTLNYLVEIQKDLPNIQSVSNFYLDKYDISNSFKDTIRTLKNKINKSSDLSIWIDKLRQGLPLSEQENQEAEAIILAYRKLLETISQLIGFDALNFTEYSKRIQNTPVEVKAHDPLSRLLKRKWLEYKPDFLRSDIDLDMRKQVTIQHISQVIDSLSRFMDTLVANADIDGIFKSLKEFSMLLAEVIEDIITLAEYHSSMFRHENRLKRRGIVLQPIIEREINKLRKANIGIREMSSKILIHRPDFVTVPT